ncbi:KIAA0368 [Cordylochernes scorpioides]|uniref:KIAA0368 n=1 Tax=Cordylochernes scorpioides TaxID=51811 RepID=A0ABY6L761_9ARAC|nr:KIAA0368 [Cordylochernes scorpioides]
MAESDNSLEQCLDRFLTPTILKLASPYEEVRNKVLELLSHVSKRVKSRPAVKLPVDALLTTLQDPQSGAFVTNFSLVYIRLGVPRLSPEKRAALLPSLLACLPGNSLQTKVLNSVLDSVLLSEDGNNAVTETSHTIYLFGFGLITLCSLLAICIPILPDVKMPPTFGEEAAKPKLGITPELHPILLPYLLNYLLIPYRQMTKLPLLASLRTDNYIDGRVDSPDMGDDSSSAAPDFCPPGLSPQDWKQLPHDSPTLEQEKMGILKLLGSGVLPGAAIVPHLVVGSADTHHSSTIWNDKHLVIKLFDLFLGYIPKKNVVSVALCRCLNKPTQPVDRLPTL